MARGPEITDEVRMLIAKLHKEHPKWTNKKIRNEVSKAMREKNPSLPKSWPSKYSIDRMMPGIRDRVKRSRSQPNPLDKPWTVHSTGMPEYSIAAEALPSVLRVWYLLQDRFHVSLTIRQARWAACLYATVTKTEDLAFWAQLMAMTDKKTEDAGIVAFMGSQLENLFAHSVMTGHAITADELARLSGFSDEKLREWLGAVFSKGPLKLDVLESPESLELSTGIHLEAVERLQKEEQNERKHRTNKNEGRHKKAR